MKNQIYRITMTGSDGKSYDLEFSIVETNDVNPYRDTLEIGVIMMVGDNQLDGSLDEAELDSLEKYLSSCQYYIRDFNKNSKPKDEQK